MCLRSFLLLSFYQTIITTNSLFKAYNMAFYFLNFVIFLFFSFNLLHLASHKIHYLSTSASFWTPFPSPFPQYQISCQDEQFFSLNSFYSYDFPHSHQPTPGHILPCQGYYVTPSLASFFQSSSPPICCPHSEQTS